VMPWNPDVHRNGVHRRESCPWWAGLLGNHGGAPLQWPTWT